MVCLYFRAKFLRISIASILYLATTFPGFVSHFTRMQTLAYDKATRGTLTEVPLLSERQTGLLHEGWSLQISSNYCETIQPSGTWMSTATSMSVRCLMSDVFISPQLSNPLIILHINI